MHSEIKLDFNFYIEYLLINTLLKANQIFFSEISPLKLKILFN